MKADLSKLPFLREKIIQVKHPEDGMTCCQRISESSEEELPKTPPFWFHMSLYRNLNKTVNALMNCTIMFRRKRNQRQEIMEPMMMVELRALIMRRLLFQEQEWSKLALNTWPPSKQDYVVQKVGDIWAILGRGLEVEPHYSEGTFRVNIQHPEAEIGFIAPILHPESLLTKSLLAYKHDQSINVYFIVHTI